MILGSPLARAGSFPLQWARHDGTGGRMNRRGTREEPERNEFPWRTRRLLVSVRDLPLCVFAGGILAWPGAGCCWWLWNGHSGDPSLRTLLLLDGLKLTVRAR